MLVALSGGPDSSALLVGLVELGIPVVAAHFDHALRDESVAEAARVAEFCSRAGVELITERRAEPLASGSVQAAARAARYRFLEDARQRAGLPVVAVGHTADDLVENVVMNVLRGSGLAGMRGMPARRGPFVRPLLGVWRDEVEAFLSDRALEPIRDPSNLDLHYARVRVRRQLLPRLEHDRPGIKARLHGAALRAADLQSAAELAAATLSAGGDRIRLAALTAASSAVRSEAFRALHQARAGGRPALERRHLAALDRLLTEGRSGDSLDLPGGVRVRRGYEEMTMNAADDPQPLPASLKLSACPGCDAPGSVHFRPGVEVALGTRRPGLRMRPAPAGRTRKLQDILVDAKVPRHLRDTLPLVFADGELAWVPGLAIDTRWAASEGSPALHVELVASKPPARIEPPTQGVLS